MVLWFKAKRYGYGWYPSTWQGAAILGLYLFDVLGQWFYFAPTTGIDSSATIYYVLETLGLTVLLIILCALTGEKARFRWGKD